jgi:hypothetical protein
MTCKVLQRPMSIRFCCALTLGLSANAVDASAGEDIIREAPVIIREAPAIARDAPAIEVRIELEKATYRLGEPFTVIVTTNQDCYVLVFAIDPNDQVELHDPVASGAYMGLPLLKAGERRTIPVPDAPGRAVITPPAGPHQIGAVCGREELAKLGLSHVELKEPAKSGRRGFEFQLGAKVDRIDQSSVTRVTVFYEVRP